jgi:LuxR family maltose regulon positive regulatory protein
LAQVESARAHIQTSSTVPTRFAPPEAGDQAILRSSLLAKLEALANRKLTVIVGGAGFGKTTLLSQWREQCIAIKEEDVAWLTVGSGEGDLRSFYAYAFEAFQRAGVEFSQTLPVSLLSTDETGMLAFVSALVNVIAEHPRNLHLIVDDSHHLTDPLARTALGELLEQSTDNFRATLAGRQAPAFPLSRLRLREQVGEIGPDLLAFDAHETATFFQERVPSPLSVQQLHHVREALDGWPAGMQLLLHALLRHEDSDSLTQLLQHNSGFHDYITENVLSKLSPQQVAFLERLSTVPRFCDRLAEAVTGDDNTEQQIQELVQLHLFVSRFELSEGETWYSMHLLFAEPLRARLAARESDMRGCHWRAAAWFAANGFLLDAVGHAKAAGMTSSIDKLIEHSPMSLRSLSGLGSMRRIVDAIDPATLAANSKLLPMGAWAFLLTAQLRRANRWIEFIAPEGNTETILQRQILEAGVALYEDDTPRIRRIVGNLHPADIEQPFLSQCLATELITAAQGAGDYDEADRVTAELASSLRHEKHEMALIVHALGTVSRLETGQALSAEQHGLKVLRQTEAVAGRRSVSSAIAAAFLADAQYELGKSDEAQQTLAGRWDMVYWSPPDPMVRGVITQVRLAADFGGPSAAFNLIASVLPRFQGRGSDRAIVCLLEERCRLELEQNRLGSVKLTLAALSEMATRNAGNQGFAAEIELIWAVTQARVLLGENRPQEAMAHLQSAKEKAASLRRTRMLVTILLLEAQSHVRLKQTQQADVSAQQAIDLCEAGGLRQSMVRAGPEPLSLLLARSCKLRMSAQLHEFLSVHARKPNDPPTSGPLSPDGLLEKLTPREVEIIQLLGQSMSNKRIAATLGIAPATVKWNLQNVFLKLGLNTRYDVLAWMRKAEAASAAPPQASR